MMKARVQLALVTAFLMVLTIFYFKSREMTRMKKSHIPEARDGENLPAFSFDDLWSSNFSYSTFSPNWVSNTSYIYRDEKGIQIADLDHPDDQSTVLVPNDFYEQTGGNGWSVSEDKLYFWIRTNYTKQWRHSYNASYAIYDVATLSLVWESGRSDIQYIKWSPVGHGLVWVVENNLFYQSNVSDSSTIVTLEDNGGKNTIFNGVPDWVYEEEMVSSTNNIFWSPDARFIAYLVTDDTQVDRIEFTNYGSTKYPETVIVAYPKAGTPNPKVTLKVFDTTRNSAETTTIVAPTGFVGSDHLFCALYWNDDGRAFQVHWMNRISNIAAPQLCHFSTQWECSVVEAGVEESLTGWIGNGGTTFRPLMLNNGSLSYFTIFSNNEGYWQIAYIEITEQGSSSSTFLTTGTSVVTSLYAYDPDFDWLYFVAAHPEPRQRHLFRISVEGAMTSVVNAMDWTCVTCALDTERCQWISPNFSPSRKYLVINCGGPDVPKSTLHTLDSEGNYGAPEVVENNDNLIANKASVKWPIKEYDEIESTSGVKILYQVHKPMDFDPNKKYPLLIEVYGGPGFQKVQDRWTRSWAPIHMVSQYDVIVVSLDGRGSGYRGDGIAHMLYKKIGQLEKLDTTEVGRHFAQMSWVDETRLAVWGWSYGGYTTSFTISEGSGVFKCGLAVAPLASRFYYDTIHTERYMTMPDDNPDGYEKCNLLNTKLENFKQASYSIIHGTADDNVHFQNAALISKALIEADVDFDNTFYADEDHSINTGRNARQHIYKLLTRKVKTCFNL